MAKNILQDLKDEFFGLPLKEQRDILVSYSHYVTEFPETHDGGSYPVTFFEWYQNDMGDEYAGGVIGYAANGEPCY